MTLPTDAPARPPALCAICQTPLGGGAQVIACPDCKSSYHAECWQENQGCAVYGCARVPATTRRGALEIPVSFWGQETKKCPRCGQEIKAAAKRCRHCGADFSSAQPETTGEFHARAAIEQELPALRRQAVWLFIFCLLPFTAPLAAGYGLYWYFPKRQAVQALPAFYQSVIRLALVIGCAQTVLFILVAVVHHMLH